MSVKDLSAILITGLGLALFAAGVQSAVEFPELTGRVVDSAELLSDNFEASLVRRLGAHEEATTNQVVVVTVASLQGLSIEQYGRDLGNHWGIGQADKNNGVLLVVAPNERMVRIEVGLGLERTLTNPIAQQIIDQDILPPFRGGAYEAGISAGIHSILAVLNGRYQLQSSASSDDTTSGWGYLVALLLAMVPRWGRHRSGGRSSFGGGGFSGGGGSFGGGGASGSW